MKKLSLAIIIAVFSISLSACTNSGVADNSNNDNSINNSVNDSPNSGTNNNITIEQAKEIALSHAGLTSSQVNFKKTELDFDDGIKKYEVEFDYNNREYSYEIDANTGKVLSYEQD